MGSPPAEAENDAVDVATDDVATDKVKHLRQAAGKPKCSADRAGCTCPCSQCTRGSSGMEGGVLTGERTYSISEAVGWET